jgi:hypothetical protein
MEDSRCVLLQNSLFPAIWDIWEYFVSICTEIYSQSEFVTIDVKLLGFRGPYSFQQYLPIIGLHKQVTYTMTIVEYPCQEPMIPKKARTMAVTRAHERKRKRCSFRPAKNNYQMS